MFQILDIFRGLMCPVNLKVHMYGSKVVPVLLIFLVQPLPAWSQSSGGTVGQVLSNFITNVWQPFFLLVAVLSAVGGLYFIARGLLDLVASSGSREQFGIAHALLKLVGGVLMFALPDVAGIGMMTILGNIMGGETLGSAGLDIEEGIGYDSNLFSRIIGGSTNVASVKQCVSFGNVEGSDVVGAAQCIANNISSNVVPIALLVLFSLAFLIGLAGLAANIAVMANMREGRGRSSFLVPICLNIMLMNASFLFRIAVETFFGSTGQVLNGNSLNSSSSLLSWSATESEFQMWCDLLSSATVILLFFGMFAFLRGMCMMKAVSEFGRQSGSYGMAGVYMVSGLLLANLKLTVGMVFGTLGFSGQNFCS